MWQQPRPVPGIACSLVISVLRSDDVVCRQCRHFKAIIPDDWEVILLDDGSQPPLAVPADRPRHFCLVYTRNTTLWTQPIARNLGARLARGSCLFLTDIDHIVSPEAVAAVSGFSGSRMMFPRSFGVLDDQGRLSRDPALLHQFGWTGDGQAELDQHGKFHQNTFAIRRELFLDAMHGGYDESLCAGGKYGGDDVEFNERYRNLVACGRAEPDALGPEIFVYPDPASSALFHNLSRV
jgi:hypothetical protein